MAALSIVIFLFKDTIVKANPNNQASQEKYSSFIKTRAAIIERETTRGRRGSSNTTYTVQYRDNNGKLYTTKLSYNSIVSPKDSTTIYYDPQNPKDIISERTYDEIM